MLLFLVFSAATPAQHSPFDSISFSFRCGQRGETCLDHRVTLLPSGRIHVLRADNLSLEIILADSTTQSVVAQYDRVRVESIPDSMTKQTCQTMADHVTPVVLDIYRAGSVRHIIDNQGCFSSDSSDWRSSMSRLRQFEMRVRMKLGVERIVDPPTPRALELAVFRMVDSIQPSRNFWIISDTLDAYSNYVKRDSRGRDSSMVDDKVLYVPITRVFRPDSAIVEIHARRRAQLQSGFSGISSEGSQEWKFFYIAGAWRGTFVRSLPD